MNERHRIFIREYLIDFNATRAALKAGYSKKTAYSQGHRLLKYAEIQEAIDSEVREMAKRAEVSAQFVLSGLAKEALEAETDSARVRAFELLGKYLKLWTDKVDVTSDDQKIEGFKIIIDTDNRTQS